MSVSRAAARDITADIEKAIAEVLEKHDLKVESVRTTYGDHYAVKITADSKDAPSAFAKYAPLLGLDPAAEGKSFMWAGTRYTIVDIAPKSWKRPIIAARADGKRFKFPTAAAGMAG